MCQQDVVLVGVETSDPSSQKKGTRNHLNPYMMLSVSVMSQAGFPSARPRASEPAEYEIHTRSSKALPLTQTATVFKIWRLLTFLKFMDWFFFGIIWPYPTYRLGPATHDGECRMKIEKCYRFPFFASSRRNSDARQERAIIVRVGFLSGFETKHAPSVTNKF